MDSRIAAPDDSKALLRIHERLLASYDSDRWHWRAETPPLAVCLGSILVQHTNWTNVETALQRLREGGASDLETIASLPEDELAALIRPAGTPLTKSRRLHAFASAALAGGGFEGLFALADDELRARLLATPGVGPETADVILLYAAHRPAVVADAYTARLFRRLGYGPERDGYDRWRAWQDAWVPADLAARWRQHAAVVLHCKQVCRVRPKCGVCPLADICAYAAD